MAPGHYVHLDSSGAEIRRLELQSAFLEPLTLRVLHSAGLVAGMSVLDIGTGAGDVALLAASLVGVSGRVVGLDYEGRMVEHASKRARALGVENLYFQTGALQTGEHFGTFDLVIARLAAFIHQGDQRVAAL